MLSLSDNVSCMKDVARLSEMVKTGQADGKSLFAISGSPATSQVQDKRNLAEKNLFVTVL